MWADCPILVARRDPSDLKKICQKKRISVAQPTLYQVLNKIKITPDAYLILALVSSFYTRRL